ncbi:hypothetical protein Salat_1405800 [Sesamum alatum]|uniref:PB1-like domain-containing protein n=1 Tax=Sesamum alatum TaxID=300844 RepID=A0AAE1YAE6_9LAMI|nr:hypothetical protein Salat_1405800 [Sesamum alatum]
MSLRHQVLVDFPDPNYAKYGPEPFVTILMYHGRKITHRPKTEYVGGSRSKFDFVDVLNISIEYLNKLGEKLGYMGPKKFYRFHTKSFRQLKLQTEIVKFTDAFSPENRIFTLYLVGGEAQNAEIGASNVKGVDVEANVEPQTEPNVAKGKGVDVEDGDLNDFADAEWDEVFKIVDSYAEGQGQREDELESQNEVDESDRLFDEGLEDSEYEMDDDEESGYEAEHGVEESGSESSDSEEATTESDARKRTSSTMHKTLVPQPAQKTAKKAKGKAMAPSNNEQDNSNAPGSQTMVHRFTQCSTSAVAQTSESGVPYLTKGGRKFVTMANLGAACAAATKKKGKVVKKK